MNVLGYDPYVSIETAWNISHHVKRVDDVKEIFANCDYITVHVPLTDETRHTFNSEAFGLMQKELLLSTLRVVSWLIMQRFLKLSKQVLSNVTLQTSELKNCLTKIKSLSSLTWVVQQLKLNLIVLSWLVRRSVNLWKPVKLQTQLTS